MPRYISENEIYALFNRRGQASLHVGDIDVLPRADVTEVVHGQWLGIQLDPIWRSMLATCSHCRVRGEVRVKSNECGFAVPDSDHCPNCGSKMDLEE